MIFTSNTHWQQINYHLLNWPHSAFQCTLNSPIILYHYHSSPNSRLMLGRRLQLYSNLSVLLRSVSNNPVSAVHKNNSISTTAAVHHIVRLWSVDVCSSWSYSAYCSTWQGDNIHDSGKQNARAKSKECCKA